ncbi:hypothetical protein AU193_22355 [Mycobacterium sp. GA-1285]|nr:hypothetical protein AU193_22355 [Mycobacterium sp. GA-1285]
MALTLAACGRSRDETSYQLGYEQSNMAEIYFKGKCGMLGNCDYPAAAEDSCRYLVKQERDKSPNREDLVLEDMVAGCIDGLPSEPR